MAAAMATQAVAQRPCVLVFAGSDPSGGAGIAADIGAINALGAHALPVITVLTVQDNDRVLAIHPVAADLVRAQAQALVDKIEIRAVKIGIVGSIENAQVIADIIRALRRRRPNLPVVLDPVLASGHGDALARDDACLLLEPILKIASLVLPNLPEALALCPGEAMAERQAVALMQRGERPMDVLIKGGHGSGAQVVNWWFGGAGAGMDFNATWSWHWPRLPGAFHGSGCTLAAACAALLALGLSRRAALTQAQAYCHQTLANAYAVADGQRIPNRNYGLEGANMKHIKGLYIVTPDWDDTEKLLAVTEQALLGGAALVQYRHKTAGPELRLEQATALLALCRRLGRRLIINDYVDLCLQLDADGVHVGGTDHSVAHVRAQLGSAKIVGASCYGSLDLAHRAYREGASYIAFGGFYPSRVKQYAVGTRPEIIAEAKAEIPLPVVVIGGITHGNAAPLVDAGADMLAVISSVYMIDALEAPGTNRHHDAARRFAALFDANFKEAGAA